MHMKDKHNSLDPFHLNHVIKYHPLELYSTQNGGQGHRQCMGTASFHFPTNSLTQRSIALCSTRKT